MPVLAKNDLPVLNYHIQFFPCTKSPLEVYAWAIRPLQLLRRTGRLRALARHEGSPADPVHLAIMVRCSLLDARMAINAKELCSPHGRTVR